MKNIFLNVTTIFLLINGFALEANKHHYDRPRVAVVIVIDQCSYRLIKMITPYVRYGLKHLIHNGVFYTNAHHPHGITCTATGHTVFNTGVYAKEHGIIANEWLDRDGNIILSDDDTVEHAAVFGPHGTLYNYGKSAINIMADGLSQKFNEEDSICHPHYVYALSHKSRSANMMAGKTGKAIWFDEYCGNFTSSKAYFNELPSWVDNFNKQQDIGSLKEVVWEYAKPLCEWRAYDIFTTDFSTSPIERYYDFANTVIPIDYSKKHKRPFQDYLKTPHAQNLLFDLAVACIDAHVNKKNNNHLLLWVSFSGIDILGHEYGQFNRAAIDLMYHFDKKLRCFMRHVNRAVGHKNTLFVLTADHGMGLLIDDLKKENDNAGVVSLKEFIHSLNLFIEKKSGISNGIRAFINSQVYFNHQKFKDVSQETFINLISELRNYISAMPFVNKVLSVQELFAQHYTPYSIEWTLKQQYYPGRSGDLFVILHPENAIASKLSGGEHQSPYTYNSHVPLIIYRHNHQELKKIHDRVYTTQLANSLAEICHVSQPSSSIEPILPGLYNRRATLIF